MEDAPINVWNEVRVTSEGISITLLSENQSGGAIVEDETWFTFDEMAVGPKSPISLNLSDETQSALGEQRKRAQTNLIYGYEEGDVLRDKNPAPWQESQPQLEVVEFLPDTRADEYVIEENAFGMRDETVADANPSLPCSDAVVLAKYDGKGDTYAFPETRVEQLS